MFYVFVVSSIIGACDCTKRELFSDIQSSFRSSTTNEIPLAVVLSCTMDATTCHHITPSTQPQELSTWHHLTTLNRNPLLAGSMYVHNW